jgi:hypothetical protein
MNKRDLWIQLHNYHFNHLTPASLLQKITEKFGGPDASTKAFADKIARKHNWKTKFALKAIHEYKKFVYLGVVSNFNVTPSKVIDVVWHEHLLFTKAYREFCNEVIEFHFEHNPELIILDEQTENFALQYIKTLQLYRYEFGYDAPGDIWELPKFSREQLQSITKFYQNNAVKKKEYSYADSGISIVEDSTPLTDQFNSDEFLDFGGGEFGGGGAEGDFSDSGSSDSGSCSSCSSGCSSCGGGD